MYANQEAAGLRLSVNGNTCVFTKEYDPTCLDTDVAGKLARRLVSDGARVKEGEVRIAGTISVLCCFKQAQSVGLIQVMNEIFFNHF